MTFDYWEVVEYSVDDFGCEYELVIRKSLIEGEAKLYAADLMIGREDYEEVSYFARKMG